jgi:hypothetical protein
MEYQIVFEIDGKRERIILEHVKEEYGVSEQEFWSVWVADKKYICGDGDTAEQAIQNMMKDFNEREEIRALFKKSIENSGAQFKTPVIDQYADFVALQYQQTNRMIRSKILGF